MAPVKTNPVEVAGPWVSGFVLEGQHTTSSEFLGHDSWGHPQFDTKRSELGELVYLLKNRGDRNAVASIAETAVQFIGEWKPTFELIVPVPPSRKREYQPVAEIAKAIGAYLSQPVAVTAVSKIKDTPQLKDVYDYNERIKLLKDAFRIDTDAIREKTILLVDDLYRSGATARVVADNLLEAGAARVTMLAMTKTRTRK
jgi:competence protein ComFC